MTEKTVLNLLCVECLEVLTGDIHRKDFQNNPVCNLCSEIYYTVCAECSRMVAIDETVVNGSDDHGFIRHCPKCKPSGAIQTEANLDAAKVAELVDEYVSLHTEEKRIKEQMEAIKEQLKTVAETQSDEGRKPVTLAGTEGKVRVKCAYRTSFKADADKVSELRDCLGQELFNTLFSEKFSFDVNKSNFEKIVTTDADLPEDVRRQIKNAVKVTVSATLNIA